MSMGSRVPPWALWGVGCSFLMCFLFSRGDQKFGQLFLSNIQTLLLLHSLAWSTPWAAGASLRQRVCRAGGASLRQVQGVTAVTGSHSCPLCSHGVVKALVLIGRWCPKKVIHLLQLPGFTEGGTSCVKFLLFFFSDCCIFFYIVNKLAWVLDRCTVSSNMLGFLICFGGVTYSLLIQRSKKKI